MTRSTVAVARWAVFLLALSILSVAGHATDACRTDAKAQGSQSGDEIEKLRDMLRRAGADGRTQRETAVERLLAMPDAMAHRVLSQELTREPDPDALRMTILQALGRHLLQTDSMQFGGAATEIRRQIFNYYLGTLSEWWRADGPRVADELIVAARDVMIRVPVRELEKSAQLLLASDNVDAPALFRCIADLQNIYLGQVLAEHVESDDPRVRAAARASLRLLTFRDRDFETRAEFVTWFERNSEVTYVDLAERAARMGAERMNDLREQIIQARIARSRDVVRAYADANPGINWDAIQKETLVADNELMDACLKALRDALEGTMPAGDSVPRQLFCRALLDRWQQTVGGQRRSLLLEVAAYSARPDEAELSAEIQAGLLGQLESRTAGEQLAALRGLRRFPSAETRAVIVRYARTAVGLGAEAADLVETAIATLSSRTAPRWLAPGPTDADKADWIALIRSVCERPELARLRTPALTLALTEDGVNLKVPEVFHLLLDFAKDTRQDANFRRTCVIRLQGWDNYPDGAEPRVQTLLALLEDPEPQLRQQAAQALGKLAKSDDKRRGDWLTQTIAALRTRLAVEPTRGVLNELVECMVACGSEPKMPENAIGAIRLVLTELKSPVPPEHEFRVEPLLRGLVAIAGSENAGNGQWLFACDQLLAFQKRQSLRHLLDERHAAIDMAKDVANADTAIANRARKAMQVLIRTALLKPAERPWGSSTDLRAEANAVRIAFGALDNVEETARLDDPVHRLLRLEVALVGGHYRDVVDKATAWLANGDPSPAPGGAARVPMTPEQRDRMRILAADAQLGLTKPDLAAKLLTEGDPTRPLDARALAVYDRVGKAVAKTDAATALALFDRARKATPVEDPAFRERLIDWATTRVRVDPQAKDAVWTELQKYSALFEAQDCPNDLREAFRGLRVDN